MKLFRSFDKLSTLLPVKTVSDFVFRIVQYLMANNTSSGLAQSLANYFGDADAVPGGLCGLCTYCLAAEPVRFDPQATTTPEPNKVRAILNACPERDDPRLLARMAFGITSPRLTAGKWSSSHPYFGCLGDVDFNVLVATFDKECKKAGYMRTEGATTVSSTDRKRSLAQSSSSRGNYSGGGGGGSKRGRYYK
jgi:hypothetical protein